MAVAIAVAVVLAVIVLILVGASVRILREYQRGVIFRLGRLIAQKGPGLILLIPLVDRMVRVDLRTITLNIPPQEVITRDNVPASVNAVAYFRVIDSSKAIVEVENYLLATSQISQTALRSVLGKAEFDQLLSERERLNEELQKIIDESTEPWGVKVTAVEIKDVEIPEQMQRAIARQAEAERERRAKIINSEGEYQAAQKLTDAADIISTNPASLQLRYLQTLLEIGSNQNTTIVFPLPMDVIEPFLGRPGERPQARAPAQLSAPEIRIDQLTGLRTILAPGRADRPMNFRFRCSFARNNWAKEQRSGRGRRRTRAPSARDARSARRPRSTRRGRAAVRRTRRDGRPGWCRTSIRRWPPGRRATASLPSCSSPARRSAPMR